MYSLDRSPNAKTAFILEHPAVKLNCLGFFLLHRRWSILPSRKWSKILPGTEKSKIRQQLPHLLRPQLALYKETVERSFHGLQTLQVIQLTYNVNSWFTISVAMVSFLNT